MMITQSYQLQLVTPAFIGGANQQAMWRTPPIKSLLRQWWRVAVAQRFQHKLKEMRSLESALFGSAGDDEGLTGRSLVRLRLDPPQGERLAWVPGTQVGMKPEKSDQELRYMAWGLIEGGKPDRTALTPKKSEGTRILRFAFPQQHAFLERVSAGYDPTADLSAALSLIHYFGTLGGRSRNGWGSVCVQPLNGAPALLSLSQTLTHAGVASVEQRLQHSWATGIARGGAGPLIWESESAAAYKNWGAALRAMWAVKRAVRGQLPLGPSRLSARHILGLPAKGYDKARMPSPLRFKVFEEADRLRFRIYAMPHGAPDHDTFKAAGGEFNKLAAAAWETVERTLDGHALVRRITMGEGS